MLTKTHAGWIAFGTSILLSIEASVARWFPAHTSAGSEATEIAALLAFAAAAFGISAYEARSPVVKPEETPKA